MGKTDTCTSLQQRKQGRPTDYNLSIATAICERVALGSNLNQLSKLDEFPAMSTIYLWLQRHREFSEMYAHARESRADARADKIDAICEQVERGELDPNSARVIIDALKWQAGKEKPRTYGDKITQEHTGPGGGPLRRDLTDEEVAKRLAELEAKARRQS
jgi:hypothetical protein